MTSALPDIEQALKDLDTYGYTVLPGLIGATDVAALKSRVDALWEEVCRERYSGRPERDSEDKLVYNLQNKDKRFLDLLGHPTIRAVAMAKLNDPYYRFLPADVPNYILGYFNARTSGQPLDLHIDSYIPSPGDFTWVMQVVVLLDDMDESNGCTTVVPGSHRSGRFTDRALERRVPLRAKAGDVVMWDSRLWHGTLGNRTGASRWALIATLSQWWVKPSMDMARGLPDEMYQQLSDEQKALLGFCSLPPRNEHERINTKTGYDALKPSVNDYF